MTDLFNTTNVVVASEVTTPTENPIEIVKTKFKTPEGELDVEGLAKGKIEADSFIERLKQEQATLRKELDTRLSYEEFLDEIKSSRTASNQPPTSDEVNEPNIEHVVGIKQEDVMRLVKETLNQERTQAQKDSNRVSVARALQENWGSSFSTKLEQKAQELNLSREFMTSMAETNPQAFLKLVDANTPSPPAPDVSPPRNTMRSQGGHTKTGERNKAYYDEILKRDKRQYWSVGVQSQMHKDALTLGDRFDPNQT